MKHRIDENQAIQRLSRRGNPGEAGFAARASGGYRKKLNTMGRLLSILLTLSMLMNSLIIPVGGMASAEVLPTGVVSLSDMGTEHEHAQEEDVEVMGDIDIAEDSEIHSLAEETPYIFNTGYDDSFLFTEIARQVKLPIKEISEVRMISVLGNVEEQSIDADAQAIEGTEALYVEPIYNEENDKITDYAVTALRFFQEAGLMVYTDEDVFVVRLVRPDDYLDALETQLMEHSDLPVDIDIEPTEEPLENIYDLNGGSSVMLSEVLLGTGLPIETTEVGFTAVLGSEDVENWTEPVSVEPVEGDYRITVLRDFDVASLALYVQEEVYTVTLANGTAAPVEPEADLAEAVVEEPAVEPVEQPIGEPASEPEEQPVVEPVPESVELPAEDQVPEPVEHTIPESVEEVVPEAIEVDLSEPEAETVPGSEAETVPESIEATIPEPVEKTVSVADVDLTPELTEDAASEPAEAPVSEPAEEPASEPAEEPASEPAEEPASEPAEEPASEPAEEPASEPIEEPASEPAEEPASEPAEEPLSEPVEEPASEPAEETASEPAEEPASEPAEEPVSEPAEEPASEPAEEPVSEPAEETVSEPEEASVDEPTEVPISYPAQTFTGRSARVRVTAEAPEGAFPEGTRMVVVPIINRDALNGYADAVTDDFVEVTNVLAVDITFYDADGNEIEPLLPISVEMSIAEIDAEEEALVLHVDDEGTAEFVEQVEATATGNRLALNVEMPATDEQTGVGIEQTEVDNETGLSFEADGFSTYVILVTRTIETRYIDASGATYQIEVGYGEDAGIYGNVELSVDELTGADAAHYLGKAAETLEVSNAELAYAKALDISILVDGQAVQPLAPVRVSVRLLDAPDSIEEENIKVLHFGEEVETVDCTLNGDAVEFDADGFSVYVVVYTTENSAVRASYRIEDGETVKLSAILNDLQIPKDDGEEVYTIDDVNDVTFAENDNLSVDAVDGDWNISSSGTFSDPVNLTIDVGDGNSLSVAVSCPEKIPLTITAASATKVYDGLVLSNEDYSVVGLAEGDRIQSITVDGAQTDVNASDDPNETIPVNNLVRNAQIVNASGEDVTNNYNINYVHGTLTVTKKPITITAVDAEKVYDGTELVADSYTSTGLADGDLFDSVTVTGSQTDAGESDNTPSAAQIVRPTEGDNVVDVNNNYDITYASGTLKVMPRALTITADSDEKVYDGTALTKDTYTVEGLAEGDSVQAVTVEGSQTNAGTADNVPSNATVVNGDGEDVTGCYDIKYTNGTLTVSKVRVKLTANSSVVVYDGTGKTVNGFTVSADDSPLEGIVFEDVSASGSGTEKDSYPVTFTGVTLNETTDTTGNYVVTETEDGTLTIVDTQPLDKNVYFSGNVATYKIKINEAGLELNGGNDLTLRDTFTDNQSIDYSSVESNPSVTYDYTGYTGTFTIPDKTTVTITYKTRVSGAAGTEVTFGNTADLGVTHDGSFNSLYSKTVSDKQTITPTGTDIEGTDGVYSIRLFAYAQNHMEQGLGGAVFRLLDANQRPITYRAGEHAGEPVTFTTEDDGYATVELDDGIISIRKNTVYYLEMTTPPVAENPDGSHTYYHKDNTLYRFLITDNPNYSGDYDYFNGDVLKVRCNAEAAGVNVTKRFSGNYSLTDEQKNGICFVLQKEDLASGDWVEVEKHTYAEFTNGSMNFKAGREGGAALEQATLYRVIEENDEIEGVDHSRSVILTYQRDDENVQEPTNEFEVDPDHDSYSFSLVFDNNYVDHELTLVKMNELTGELLSGAKFTVYSAQTNTAVKTYTTDSDGEVVIRHDDEQANYATDTAYYVVETGNPANYLMPKDPEKIYFYFSGESTGVPQGIPSGTTAVDLTSTFDTVIIDNQAKTVDVPVTVTWDVDGEKTWPEGVVSEITLYQSVNGETTPVKNDGAPLTVTLDADKTYDNTTFVNLPARDDQDNDITYSVVQEELPNYYTSYKVSGTGWYVVKNESAVSVTVAKEWYGQGGQPDTNGRGTVKFDLYRTTEDQANIDSRDNLEAVLRGEEPVMTGLELSTENNWTNTINSLQKQDASGNPYYYFALEREDSMPRNNEDSYAVVPASGDTPRTLTIKNKQTPVTVIIKVDDCTKAYGADDPVLSFTTEVQDDDCEISEPVKGEGGQYTVDVTQDGETKQITFTCSRVEGEDVGSYAIELDGNAIQQGYRVRLDDGTLTITPAQVTVKGTATKFYGDPDPALVEIKGMKEGDTIDYYAYRDIGEQKGSYRITVTGLTKQGNYEITYVNDYLTIEPAPVTVTADNLSKEYGATDPALTVTIKGLKNNDANSVIKYDISRAEGEEVGEYDITVTGNESQGNYTVAFVNSTFTITGHKITVESKNFRKTYGDSDPSWDNWKDDPEKYVKITGLREGETIDFSFTRQEGEDVGEYTVTLEGAHTQGNAEVTYVDGILTIDKADLTITPVNVVKALTDPVTPDPQLTVDFDTLVNHDDEIVPAVAPDGDKWIYTYTREGKTEPEFAFSLTRTPGETAGSYVIAASPVGNRPRNYNITYKTGIFTILATYNVVINQQTLDLVDYNQNPDYAYTAVLDASAIGIENYTAEGFVDNSYTFTLPADGASSMTLPIPAGAKLTVTQDTTKPDYTTAITLDSSEVSGTTVEINPVNKAYAITVTHERIALPVEARAAQRQTSEGKADEEGAVAVTPLAYLGIPRAAEEPHAPIPMTAADFIAELDGQGVYNLPEDKYYVAEHASVYNGDTQKAVDVQAIQFDAESGTWQYSLNGTDYTSFVEGDQLVLFYMPRYICRVQDGTTYTTYYTLNDALKHIRDTSSGTGVIEMLIERYTIPASDNLTIPKNYNITLTTAEGLETSVILRKPNNVDHMFKNEGTFTLDRVTLDGNKSRVTANNAMVLNNGGTLTVSGNATLQNAAGNNGGAIYAGGGSVTVAEGATFTGNTATNGGAIYFREGSLSIATNSITGNSATYGGAVYVSDSSDSHTLTLTGSLSGNNATNGGAAYMAGGKLELKAGGAISSNEATNGGAVFMTGGTIELAGGTVSDNEANDGGAVYLTGGTMNLSGSTLTGNTAGQNGGAVYSSNATVSVTGGEITNNAATNGNGGGIYLASGTASIGAATVQRNKAENGYGGAISQAGGTLTVTGTLDDENTANNGSAVYVQTGSATFDSAIITGNVATAGGAIGVGSSDARLFFSGNAVVKNNTWRDNGVGNLYLNLDTDLVINTAGLESNADIGVRVAENLLTTRGDVGCKFGTYTGEKNLSKFKNDVYTGLVACDNNYKIIWSKAISVQVVRLNGYASAFPPNGSTSQIKSFTYNPKSQTNNIYDLVMEMYNAVYKSGITGDDLYAYSFASTATDFSQFLSAINWDSANQRWNFVERTGNSATGTPSLKIYYSQGAYISIVNNSPYDLTVDSMTVLEKPVPIYGYPTVKNNITLDTLTPVTAGDLVLKSGENVKLLFPGAVNQNWKINGTFTDPKTGDPVSNAPYTYTLDRTHGGKQQSGTADANGRITHSGKTVNSAGGSYEVLFGDPTYICKVTDDSGEHPFPTLNAAWNYIIDHNLTYTYTKDDGTTITKPGGTIEMLVDYLQPLNDVLNINEASFTSRGKDYTGYCLKLTTAATSGVQYPYVGAEGVTRATISRDSDNDGAAVIAMPYKKTKAATATECDAFLIVDNLTFDGKALAKKGNGGAISTANNVVTITRCDFKGYQAVRGGAIFVAWGALTVGGDNPNERCTFSNCSTGANSGDKIGGGGIWTSAQNLVVKNCDFDTCACILGNSQGGGIFHNIRQNGKSVFEGDGSGDYAKFPTGYSLNSSTLIEGCDFKNCYSVAGSGGTVETDSMVVTVKGCSFDGSYSNKNNANGGALNVLHNDAFGSATIYTNASLTVIDTTFKNCQTNTGSSFGGAICDQNSVKTEIINCAFINCSANKGGAIVTNREGKVPTDLKPGVIPEGITVSILGSRFENCTARAEGGAVHTTATKLTISDNTYEDDNGQNVTAIAWFKNCSAPSYGGVYQAGNVAGSEVSVNNVYFENCSSGTNNGGALVANARSLSITGAARENENDSYTFTGCSAGKSGGAVYHSPSNPVKDTLTNVSFYNCSAKAEGGGARLASTSIEISGAEVRNCEAVTNGGGIYISGASTLTDCVFSGNKATGETSNGGSLYINSGTVGITGGSFSDSIAVNGGGIYNKGALTISKATAENTGTITNCVARTSGGGIYTTTNKLTLDGATISDCYAVTSGGGIYHHTGNLDPYGTITRCYAPQGGGVASNGALSVSDPEKSMLITDCHAVTVTVADDGTATAETEHLPENKGGGIYNIGNNLTLQIPNATISRCTAYDGGGVYNNGGTLSFSNGNFYGNTASNNGGAIYKKGGSATMSGGVIGGSAENAANRAQLGAGIFVANGQSITIGGGRITHNVAEVGGAVAVGGNNTNTQLLFQGAPVIRDNTTSAGDKCNVYLNYDTNGIIRTTDSALAAGAYIGVYVTDELFNKHGNYGLPFGTYYNNKPYNLASFYNDRIYAGGLKGSSNNQIVWGEYVCKITDDKGNLLYTDQACENPAVYTTLENDNAENTTSAFGMLSYTSPNLYNADGKYSGAFQIQMLVGDYSCTKQIKLKNGSKDITLTTASRTPDECGFYYSGTADQAVVRRAATYGSMIHTNKMSSLVIENITIDGGSEKGFKSKSNGGILFVTDGTQVYLKENATLCNSELTKTADNKGTNGGGIRMEGSDQNHLYINGGVIKNCKASVNISNSGYGGGISAKNGDITMNSGLITECTAEGGGGAVVVEKNMYMNGGTITGNNATKYGGGIELKGTIYFTGNPVISGNTLNGSTVCNLQLMNNNNTSIYADGLGPFAEIRVYTDSAEGAANHQIRSDRGGEGDSFATWTNDANLHCFINDVTPTLRGMKVANDKLVYWRENAFLTVGKIMDSDWAADKEAVFDFTVTLDGQSAFSGTYGDMTFNNGVSSFTLKSGQFRTASDLPFDFIHDKVQYTVEEILAEGQTTFTTKYSLNGGDPVDGMTVTGTFGENMSDNPQTSSSVSRVEFTNTRAKDDLTVSKTVSEAITGDTTMPFTFTVTLGDNTITKTYDAKHYQDETDTVVIDETISFVNGVGTFHLIHGQSIKIMGLPTELDFKVEEKLTEEQYANFRSHVTVDDADETVSYSGTGKIGEVHSVAFRNNRYGLVCKIVNDTEGREQLYYREGNNPNVDPTPAIFDELEKAFEAINSGINFFTVNGAGADDKLRIEMVKPNYPMKRSTSLAQGYNVTLGTALKTDRLYPYPTDAESPAVVSRDFERGSMIVDSGNLTLDNITLDGNGAEHTATSDGGIVQVNGANTLTVTSNATLRNSTTSGNGGAIWIGESNGLVMNGTISNCQAQNGGGVYADNGFGNIQKAIEISGSISGCTATAGNGGAIYANSASENLLTNTPLVLTGSAMLKGNGAVSEDGNANSGSGGAVYSAANAKIDSANVSVTGNTAASGGGIYLAGNAAIDMTGGTLSGNRATNGNGGGIVAQSTANFSNVIFQGNSAANGNGGAIYTATTAEVSIDGDTVIKENNAKKGGAIYDQVSSFTMSSGTVTGNSATDAGGAVYVTAGHTFTMNGGTISGNQSSKGAVYAEESAVLSFSGDASVTNNTFTDGTTAMNVYLDYHSNAIINASNLTDDAPIGVYVASGNDAVIYNNHGIAGRPFGTGIGEYLYKFVNDKDNSLRGTEGPNGLMIWPGKDLLLQVYRNQANAEGQKTTPVVGANFSLANSDGTTIWSGESDASGMVRIPWGTSESKDGDVATFMNLDNDGYFTNASYVLSQQEADGYTVLPAGSWELTIGADNGVTWETQQADSENVNRTLDVEPSDDASLGDTFRVYNDVKPLITFDPNGGKFAQAGKDDATTKEETIPFGPQDYSYTYTITEPNPTKESYVFRAWRASDGNEYKQGDTILFYRHSLDDDLTLTAMWEGVICKITDRNNNLLYVNGSPAVYMSLKAGFDDFNEASFTTFDGVKATPRKIKMLVGSYEMTETVELARGKIAELTTASDKDTDGYKGPADRCVITRASTFDSGSMIVDKYNLVLRNIVLDGAGKTIDGNGGILKVQDNASSLTLAQDAELRNAKVTGYGGAVYAYGNTTVTVSNGSSINGCQAANGGAIYADEFDANLKPIKAATVNVSGGEISGNTATTAGGGIYATGTVNLTGGEVKDNKAEQDEDTTTNGNNGGGLYLSENASLTMRGGSITGNSAANGGGVYADGTVKIDDKTSVISGNAADNGGGLYVNGSLTLSAGSIGASDDPNTAENSGGGVYLAGSAELTGGSISYNGKEATGNGGGLYIAGDKDVVLNGTELSHNQAANGGAVYVNAASDGSEAKVTFAKGKITDNSATENGGGVYTAGNFELTGGSLASNNAENGGGAYVAPNGSMTMNGGAISNNTANDGAAVYVDGNADASGTLRIESGATKSTATISGNTAENVGGAVYLKDYAQMYVSGGTISGNSAEDPNGGAVNVGGEHARIYLSGSPTIFNNPGNAATAAQKNVVLSVHSNAVINTTGDGLTGGTVGVYVVDDLFDDHGTYNKPFGTFDSDDANRENAKYLVNDRDLALYGMAKEDDDNTIYWQDAVCKVTNASDKMLYKQITINGTSIKVYVPAVYGTLKDGIDAENGTLYLKQGSRYRVDNTGDVKVKMLRDYELDENEVITYSAARNLTLTTAETEASSAMMSNGDTFVFTPAQNAEGDHQTKATLTRDQATSSMFTVNTPNNTFDVSDIIIDGGNNGMMKGANVNGGAFDIEAVKSSAFTGVTLQNLNATGNGGAIYLKEGKVTLTGTEITGSAATNGGAVYVSSGATVSLNGAETDNTINTINGNAASENGAGIYLEEGSTLNLEGRVSFGGTGRNGSGADADIVTQDAENNPVGNFVNGRLPENTQNGQKDYTRFRQDIYAAGYLGAEGTDPKPATSIVVTGAINADAGSIWVAAQKPSDEEENNHYEMLKQFAVFAGGVKNTLNNSGKLEQTMTAFRNAWNDEITGCGADYLTGQEGDDLDGWNCIYWTGGFDFVFRKIDNEGNALDGAVFTLYMAVEDNGKYVPARKDSSGKYIPATRTDGSDWAAYQQTDKVNGGKKNAEATSKNIAAANAINIKYTQDNGATVENVPVYGDGLAAFEKIPPAVYFVKENLTNPTAGTVTIDSKDYKPAEEMYLVDLNGKGYFTFYTASQDANDPVWEKNEARIAPVTTFVKGDDDKYTIGTGAEDETGISIHNVMNLSPYSRKVILKKVDADSYGPLDGAEFTLYYADKQTVVMDEDGNPLTGMQSGTGGAFFIGKLPYGTYYLEETKAPSASGYEKPEMLYAFVVDADGVKINKAATGEASYQLTNELNPNASAAAATPTNPGGGNSGGSGSGSQGGGDNQGGGGDNQGSGGNQGGGGTQGSGTQGSGDQDDGNGTGSDPAIGTYVPDKGTYEGKYEGTDIDVFSDIIPTINPGSGAWDVKIHVQNGGLVKVGDEYYCAIRDFDIYWGNYNGDLSVMNNYGLVKVVGIANMSDLTFNHDGSCSQLMRGTIYFDEETGVYWFYHNNSNWGRKPSLTNYDAQNMWYPLDQSMVVTLTQ